MILSGASKFPSITLLNAQSLLPKIDEVIAVIKLKCSSILCITETWLNDTVDSALLEIPNYTITRSDRSNRKGGGTAVYVRNDLKFDAFLNGVLNSYNCNCSLLDVIDVKLFLICIYILPNTRADDLRLIHDSLVDIVDSFLAKKPNYRYCIVGDFNHFDVAALSADLNLTDLVKSPTRANNILDHILISHDLREVYDESLVTYDCPIGRSDHLMVTCRPLSQDPQNTLLRYSCVLDLRKSNVDALVSAAHNVNWSDVVPQDSDVDTQWNSFYNCVLRLIESHIPKHSVCLTDNDKEWITPLTKFLIQERWNAYRCRQWDKYNHLREKVKKEIRRAKEIWANKMMKSTNGLWKLVSNVRNSTSRDPLGNLINEFESADCLLRALHSKMSKNFTAETSSAVQTPDASTDDDIWNIEVSEYSVRSLLSKLPQGKATGHDGNRNIIYSRLAEIIAFK